MWEVSDVPQWMKILLPDDSSLFTHVRFDTTAYNLTVPGGISCTTTSSTSDDVLDHTGETSSAPSSSDMSKAHIPLTRAYWANDRQTLVWHRDEESNRMRLIWRCRDGIWTPNMKRHRLRPVPVAVWRDYPEAEGASVMVSLFKRAEDDASSNSSDEDGGRGSRNQKGDQRAKWSLDNLFSDCDENESEDDNWDAFYAMSGGNEDAALQLMEAVDLIADALLSVTPLQVCAHCDSFMDESSKDAEEDPSGTGGDTNIRVESDSVVACAAKASRTSEFYAKPHFCGTSLVEPVTADAMSANPDPNCAGTGTQPTAEQSTEKGTQTKPDKPKKVCQAHMPRRLLEPCDVAIEHEEHGINMSCACWWCQAYAMRDRNHQSVARPIIRLGGVAVDLAERTNADCKVQTCLCGVTMERREKVRKIYVAIPMAGKKKQDLKKAIVLLLLRVEFVFGGSPVTRLHADREGGLGALRIDLSREAILVTTTAGNDSKGNAWAEGAILMMTRLARISLGRALAAFKGHERVRIANLLWGHAMAHAGDWLSITQAEEYGKNDPPDMKPSFLGTNDITHFLCDVLYRKGGKVKADRVEPTGLTAQYLHPHHLTAQGSSMMVLGEGFHVEAESTTVRPVFENGKPRYPQTFPLKETTRPPFGESNDFFSWCQCTQCQKYRCVPRTTFECLTKWNLKFVCSLHTDAEGIAHSCEDPEDLTPEDTRRKETKRGLKGTRKHAGQSAKKRGRPLGSKNKKPAFEKQQAKRKAKKEAKRQENEDFEAALGESKASDEATSADEWNGVKLEGRLGQAIRELDAALAKASTDPQDIEVPQPESQDSDEFPAAVVDQPSLKKLYEQMSAPAKERVQQDSAKTLAKMCRILGKKPEDIKNRTCEGYNCLMDWFSTEESIRQDEEMERETKDGGEVEPIELGEYEVYKYRAGAGYHPDSQPGSQEANSAERDKDVVYINSVPESITELTQPVDFEATAWYAVNEPWHIKYADAHVYQSLRLKDAKLRSDYEKTVKVEIGRMVDFGCWGRPVARQSIRNDAWVYRVNMLYGIKNVEIPEKSKDKARLVLMGNLRFTKSGKLLLDKWFRSPGEFWAPASSMAGLRMVAALAVILGLPIETIDLDSAYLQTYVKTEAVDYLELVPEVIEAMTEDWQIEIEKAREVDRSMGGSGEVVFPLVKNMYGKTPSGKNFINDLQTHLEQLGWKRMPHCPGSFLKFCPITGLPQMLANYVDDFAAVMTDESRANEWNALAQSWKFDPPRRSERFLGIEMRYPDPKNLRCLELEQCGYLDVVIGRYEKARGITVPPLMHLPADEPPWPEGLDSKGNHTGASAGSGKECGTIVRQAIGGIAYAARGDRLDLMKAFHTLARRVTKWDDEAEKFLKKVLGYCKHTLNKGLCMDATGTSRNPADWRIDVSVDASQGPKTSPWCQSGYLVALSPIRNADGSEVSLSEERPPFLAVDWVSNGQEYVKLAPAESETVGMVQAARGGLKYKFAWDDITELEEKLPMLVRVDNTQAKLFAERGWSPTMAHMSRVYGINVLWITERILEGWIKLHYEPTAMMLADPLTKMKGGEVFEKRGIMKTVIHEVESAKAEFDENLKQNTVRAWSVKRFLGNMLSVVTNYGSPLRSKKKK